MTRPTPISEHGLVTAPQSEAAYEGARVLDDGGNAADAVVTAAFVQGIVDPHRCGIGGFGCATVYLDGEAKCIDFHGRAGSLAKPDVWLDKFESPTPDGFGYLVKGKLNDVGYQAITVPGMLAGLAAIHQRYGSMPWRDLVLRAVPYAAQGFRVPPELAEFWIRPGLFGRVSTHDRLALTEAGRKICFHDDGSTYKAGEALRQRELAATYRRLADEGAESFYRGAMAREISEDWERNGALVTGEDLAKYEPQIHDPVRGSFRGLDVLSTPLPGGGVALLQTLKLVELAERSGTPIVPASRRHGPFDVDFVDGLAQVLRAVWDDRLTNQGDPAFGTLADETLLADETFLTDEYLAELAGASGASEPKQAGADCSDTTQVTAVDRNGGAVSFSHSLGYNSGVFHPTLGILFNNCMSAFDPRPGSANSIAPGKARSTAVAETIVLENGRPRLVLGSPGASRITAGLAEVILNVVDFGMDIAEAVSQPRFDGYGDPAEGDGERRATLLLESRFPPMMINALEDRGWNITQSPKPFGVVGRVYAVEITRTDPLRVVAGVDPGAPGAAVRGGEPTE